MNYSRPETKFCDYAALPKGHEALLTISGNVRNTATLLEALVVTKMRSVSGFDLADA
jgi:hypothetical protein